LRHYCSSNFFLATAKEIPLELRTDVQNQEGTTEAAAAAARKFWIPQLVVEEIAHN
jgi:hypothetical protein